MVVAVIVVVIKTTSVCIGNCDSYNDIGDDSADDDDDIVGTMTGIREMQPVVTITTIAKK
jgi:hypothetical protein